MNDAEIRGNFHRKKLRLQHNHADTLVVDELGLNHGECRADIAVINGHLVGYEIKSNKDSLRRLEGQVSSYNTIFDKAFIIVGDRYIDSISNYVPDWWGIIASKKGLRGAVNFHMIRKAEKNKSIEPLSIARLLWRDEAAEILKQKGIPPKILRQPRAILYEHLVAILSVRELQKTVREFLKNREDWRCPESPFQDDD